MCLRGECIIFRRVRHGTANAFSREARQSEAYQLAIGQAMPFSEKNYQLHIRQISALMGQYHLGYLRLLLEAFDGDLELPLILGEVASRNISGQLKDSGFFPQGIDQQLISARENGEYLPCSAMSVSLATGLPRETVRRKLNKLVQNGFLEKMPDRAFVITRKPMDCFAESLNKQLLANLLAVCAKLSSLLNDPPASDGK
jgi:DNA-binding transcriptional regulator YhcF (GntR family)